MLVLADFFVFVCAYLWYWYFGIWFLTLDMCIIVLQIVRPEPGTSAKQGDAIKSGTIIRLQHMRTRKWLHSHLHASPISGNLEVCSFCSFTCVYNCMHSHLHASPLFTLGQYVICCMNSLSYTHILCLRIVFIKCWLLTTWHAIHYIMMKSNLFLLIGFYQNYLIF
jgi:hypothetical protein